ncbi:hypothetical protein Vafri_1814, partial [Volvox africanus]
GEAVEGDVTEPVGVAESFRKPQEAASSRAHGENEGNRDDGVDGSSAVTMAATTPVAAAGVAMLPLWLEQHPGARDLSAVTDEAAEVRPGPHTDVRPRGGGGAGYRAVCAALAGAAEAATVVPHRGSNIERTPLPPSPAAAASALPPLPPLCIGVDVGAMTGAAAAVAAGAATRHTPAAGGLLPVLRGSCVVSPRDAAAAAPAAAAAAAA